MRLSLQGPIATSQLCRGDSVNKLFMFAASFICVAGVSQDEQDATARVRGQLEAAAAERRDTAAGLLAADRDVILWEQRLQQEREMQARTSSRSSPLAPVLCCAVHLDPDQRNLQ